jgi:5'-methylthioadenosine phosphorylase
MIGIIGGTALGQALGTLGPGRTLEVDTPFGKPSAPLTLAIVEGVEVALLPRHGVGHVTPPSAVNYRANLWALKKVGVTQVLATTAVGSLGEEIHPRHLVIPDQVIDRTTRRVGTFFDDVAVHVEFAAPFCPSARRVYLEVAPRLAATVHPSGTYVCMEGPAFSTRAESELHRSWGAHLIGMTVMPEAKLAREAELCYAPIAMPTDFDCWRPHPETLSEHALLDEVLGNLAVAQKLAIELIRAALPKLAAQAPQDCSCRRALDNAVFSDLSRVSPEARARHALLLERFLTKVAP